MLPRALHIQKLSQRSHAQFGCFDTCGIGEIVAGMSRQDYDLGRQCSVRPATRSTGENTDRPRRAIGPQLTSRQGEAQGRLARGGNTPKRYPFRWCGSSP
jgi:hypothetical protein